MTLIWKEGTWVVAPGLLVVGSGLRDRMADLGIGERLLRPRTGLQHCGDGHGIVKWLGEVRR